MDISISNIENMINGGLLQVTSGGTLTASTGVSFAMSTNSGITSTVPTGTAPFTITSTTLVNNLNADLLEGLHSSSYVQITGDQSVGGVKTFLNNIKLNRGTDPERLISMSATDGNILIAGGTYWGNGAYIKLTGSGNLNTGGKSSFELCIGETTGTTASKLVLYSYDGISTFTQKLALYGSGGYMMLGIGTPTEKLDVDGNIKSSGQLISSVTGSTAPLVVGNATNVTNLNADLLDGLHSTAFAQLTGGNTFTGNQIFDTNTFVIDSVNDKVGVGTNTPGAGSYAGIAPKLDVFNNGAFSARIQREITGAASTSLSALVLSAKSTGDMSDGFGAGMLFVAQDDTQTTDSLLASISGLRDGADNSGKLSFRTYNAGSISEKMGILANGNVGIATTSPTFPFQVNGQSKIQSGSGNGGLVLGADVSNTTITSGVRKLARITMPSLTSATNTVIIDGDISAGGVTSITVGGITGGSQLCPNEILFGTQTGATTGGNIRMYIGSGGKIGIGGTITPENILDISQDNVTSGTTTMIRSNNLTDSSFAELKLTTTTAANSYKGGAIRYTRSATGATERLAISSTDGSVFTERVTIMGSNGYVGILNTAPTQPLTVAGNILTNSQLQSTVATGTSPLTVVSTTMVNNLNVQYLNGIQSSSFAQLTGATFTGALGTNSTLTVSGNTTLYGFTSIGTQSDIIGAGTIGTGGSTTDTITGVSTTFLTSAKVGDCLVVAGVYRMIRSVDSDTQIKLFNWTSFTNGTSYSISKAVLSNINGNKTFQFGTPGQSLLSSDGNESVLTVMNSNASSGFGTIRIMGNAPTNAGIGQGFVCNIIGERYARNVFYNDGVIGWSPGTATRDVFLSRDTTNSLTIGTNPWDLVTTSNRTANLNVYGSQTISNYNDNTYQLNLIANKTNSTGRAGIRMEYGGNAASIQHQNNELLLTQSTTTVDYNQFQMTDTRICLNNGAKDIDFVVNKLTTDSAIYYDAGLDVTKIGANTAGNYVSIDGSGDITMVGTAELNAHTIISPFVKQRQIIDYCTVSADSAPFRRYSNGTGASIAKSAAVAGVFGGLDMTTGSLTTGTAEIYSEKFHVMSTEKYSCYARFKTPAVMPSASDAYRIVFGFYQAADSTTVGGTDSIMIRVGRNTVDGEIAYVTRNNGTGDSTGRYTGIGLSGATYYDFRIDVNATGTSSDFYYKTRAATSWTTIATGVTTNMPTNRGGLFFGMFLWNGNPATTRTLILNEIALTKTLP